jgi:hypothetical protein
MEPKHNDHFGVPLDQKVVEWLALRRGRWCCDRCLMLALDRPEQHAVEYITDALAANGTCKRSRGRCAICGRGTLVTMAIVAAQPPRQGVVRFV